MNPAAAPVLPTGRAAGLRAYLRMIKFSHSVFALPFALTGMILAAGGWPPWRVVGWIVLAMVGARSGAMGFNRLVDRRLDAANPRTADRELPRGILRPGVVALFVVLSFALFVAAASRLNRLCLALSPAAIAWVCFYSYTKRFTRWSHLVLGTAIGLAPLGAWIAVTGRLDPPAFLLGGIVMLWIAGFDILYALQDLDHDRRAGLHSLPSRWGAERALRFSRRLHAAMFLLLIVLGAWTRRGAAYAAGVLLTGLLLANQHRLVKADDLSRLDAAFFTMNASLSVGFFFFTFLDIVEF